MKKYVLEIGEKEYTAEVKSITTEEASIVVNGSEYKVKLKEFGRKKISVPQAAPVTPTAPAPSPAAPMGLPPKRPSAASEAGAGAVRAPLPGLILDVNINEGDAVKAGQNIIVMEAMKMENQVQAPHDGTVSKLFVKKGDSVAEGDSLLEIARPVMTTL